MLWELQKIQKHLFSLRIGQEIHSLAEAKGLGEERIMTIINTFEKRAAFTFAAGTLSGAA